MNAKEGTDFCHRHRAPPSASQASHREAERDNTLRLLVEEKRIYLDELRSYSSFMFKYLPLTGSLFLATFGYATKDAIQLIFVCIPFLLMVFTSVFLYINYNMIATDGYVRMLERALNKLAGMDVYRKNSVLLAEIYGGHKTSVPLPFVLTAGVTAIILGLVYLSSMMRGFWYLLDDHSPLFAWGFLLFASSAVAVLLWCYFSMHRRINVAVTTTTDSYIRMVDRICGAADTPRS